MEIKLQAEELQQLASLKVHSQLESAIRSSFDEHAAMRRNFASLENAVLRFQAAIDHLDKKVTDLQKALFPPKKSPKKTTKQ